MNSLPEGKSRISTSIRDLDRRVKRLEPRSTPGMLTSVDPTGVSQVPVGGLKGNSSSKSKNYPRYR